MAVGVKVNVLLQKHSRGEKKLTTIYVYIQSDLFLCKSKRSIPFFVDNKAKRAMYYYNRGGQKSEGET